MLVADVSVGRDLKPVTDLSGRDFREQQPVDQRPVLVLQSTRSRTSCVQSELSGRVVGDLQTFAGMVLTQQRSKVPHDRRHRKIEWDLDKDAGPTLVK